MTETVNNIELDKENVEFNNAAEFVRHTDKLVYLTGKAGTGKTTFLKYIKKITTKNTVVLAPTGVAAINAEGVTIHSFFQIPLGPFVHHDSRLRNFAPLGDKNKETIFSTFKYNKGKRKIIESLELLIIDEVSMVCCDILDVVDKILRAFRKKPNLPFGGVQVILIGDTFQLPPVVENSVWKILSQFYKTPFFFSSKVIEQNKPLYIELKKIYRQNEQEFIDLLGRIRINKVTDQDIDILNSKYDPAFTGNGHDYIMLATHNRIVDTINSTKLDELNTDLFTFEANIEGKFEEKKMPTDEILNLKVGAQIMFVKNDSNSLKRYYNGKLGIIKRLEKEQIFVVFDNYTEIKVERDVWKNIKYSYNSENKRIEEDIIGTFEQFPIRLAWAITVHKSQGLTFEKVIVDLGSAFAPGQVYVALSRCVTFNGLVLKTKLDESIIITDPRVLEFAENETPNTLIIEELNTGKADFFYKKAREHFSEGNFELAYTNFIKAKKHRNDIETDDFKRYFKIQLEKLFSYKKHLQIVQNEKYQKISDLDEKIELLKKEISHNDEEINHKADIISELQESFSLLEEEKKDDCEFIRGGNKTTINNNSNVFDPSLFFKHFYGTWNITPGGQYWWLSLTKEWRDVFLTNLNVNLKDLFKGNFNDNYQFNIDDLHNNNSSFVIFLDKIMAIEYIHVNMTWSMTKLRSPLENLPKLISLSLHFSDTSVINPLVNLYNLEKLHLYLGKGSYIGDDYLKNLISLKQLDLVVEDEVLCDIRIVERLTNLEKLTISSMAEYFNFNQDWVDVTSNLFRLKDLDFSSDFNYFSKLDDINFNPILKLTDLNKFSFSCSNIKNFEIFTPLKHINILHIEINDTVLPKDYNLDISPLGKLTNLKELFLYLSYSEHYDEPEADYDDDTLGGVTFGSHLDIDLNPLSNLTNLEKIELGYTSYISLGFLSSLTNLKTLTLKYNKCDLTPLDGLKNLEELNLAGNKADIDPIKNLIKKIKKKGGTVVLE